MDMKVPPLIINLKKIETTEKLKKHKKHKKHKHKHSHHDHQHQHHHHHHHHHHHQNQNQTQPQPTEPREKPPVVTTLNPPSLEAVDIADQEATFYHTQYSRSSAYPSPDDHLQHPVPTPPSQLEKKQQEKEQEELKEQQQKQQQEEELPPEESLQHLEPSQSEQDEHGLKEQPMDVDSHTPIVNKALTPTSVEQQAGAEQNTPEVALEQPMAQQSAEEPTKTTFTTEMSFLRLTEDGGVRLRIITPMDRSEDDCERVINLEQICGQLQDGLDVIPTDINEEECREQMQVNPVAYIEPQAFGTHLPIKDSTFANLTKEDSEALLDIYGSETGFEYAESLQCFATGTNYSNRMVDSLLNLLTDGDHKKVSEDEVQKQLDEIDNLLNELKRVQEKRLSSSPSPVEPDDHESKLADDVIQKMTKLIKDKAKPGEICDSSSIFKALGVDLVN